MHTTRRNFLTGCGTAAVAATFGRVTFAGGFGPAASAANDGILVVIFCRGGWDSLSLVPPHGDAIYATQRGSLTVNGALAIDPQNSTFKSAIGLHPNAAPLAELYRQRSLAIVHACGLNDDTRSHFEAMDYIERGTPGDKSTSSGWLTRHLAIVGGGTGTLPTVAIGSTAPVSLLADAGTVSMNNINNYGLSAPWRYNNPDNPAMLNVLKKIYDGSTTGTRQVGQRTIQTIEAIQALKRQRGGGDLNYTPKAGLKYAYPSGWPTHDFGQNLKLVAQTIKLNLGVRLATVDLGGWDTHENQGVNDDGYFARMVDGLSRGLHAFYSDLSDYSSKLTVVVLSEFGRRLGANVSGGTDHGHGNAMLVLGGGINGGKVYGAWPGLEDLDQSQDLKVTTDFRSVLGEVLERRLGNSQIGTVFPGFSSYQPLGLF